MGLAGAKAPLFPSLPYLMSCGAPMSPAEKIAARQTLTPGFLENYGSTMAGMLTLLESKDIDAHGNSVGRPLPHVRVQIVDGEDRPLPPGEVGAIRARTPGVGEPISLGSGEDERTSDLLIDGWIYPGDIGALEDGFLKIVGRSSDMIVRGGAKVYPSEVEGVLAEHEAIAEVAVVGWPDPKLGEEVAAFVVLRRAAARDPGLLPVQAASRQATTTGVHRRCAAAQCQWQAGQARADRPASAALMAIFGTLTSPTGSMPSRSAQKILDSLPFF